MAGKRLNVSANRFSRDIGENPLEGMANLADIMLVFVCGLMVSLIMFWHVNLKGVMMIIDPEQMTKVEDAEILEQQQAAFSNYDDLGTAYTDPQTGETIVIGEEE